MKFKAELSIRIFGLRNILRISKNLDPRLHRIYFQKKRIEITYTRDIKSHTHSYFFSVFVLKKSALHHSNAFFSNIRLESSSKGGVQTSCPFKSVLFYNFLKFRAFVVTKIARFRAVCEHFRSPRPVLIVCSRFFVGVATLANTSVVNAEVLNLLKIYLFNFSTI